jgi:hypothetical protein
MGYNITITAKNVQNTRELVHAIAEIVESASGKKAIIQVHKRQKELQKAQNLKGEMYKKLLK